MGTRRPQSFVYKLSDVGLMAPEGEPHVSTWQHDAWALGCVLYEALHGQSPWHPRHPTNGE
eukprot:gene21003-2503_t